MDGTIKFIHTSDIHIGVETHGRLNPATGRNFRLDDVLSSLDYVFTRAVEEDVDLVLIPGDIFHRENPHPTEETEFAKRVNKLINASRCEVIIVLGNHDYPSGSGRAAAVEIFPALDLERIHVIREPQALTIETRSGVVNLICMPWQRRSTLIAKEETKGLTSEEIQDEIESRTISIIRGLTENLDNRQPNIFMGHLSVRDSLLSGTELSTLSTSDPSIPLGELQRPELAYAALGHVHRFQDLNKGTDPPVVYSGSIERIDFSEQKEDKGFVLGELIETGGAKSGRSWKCRFEFITCPARRFITIDLSTDTPPIDTSWALKKINEQDIADAVVKIRYKSSDADSLDLKEIRTALREAFSYKLERSYDAIEKARRLSELSTHTGAMDALKQYIDSKPELNDLSEKLISYAEGIIKEVDEKD